MLFVTDICFTKYSVTVVMQSLVVQPCLRRLVGSDPVEVGAGAGVDRRVGLHAVSAAGRDTPGRNSSNVVSRSTWAVAWATAVTLQITDKPKCADEE